MLKIVAMSWNALADAVYMPDLVKLLEVFPTLAAPFLADQINLVKYARRFSLRSDDLCYEKCSPQWVRTAASLEPVIAYTDSDWDTVTKKYMEYIAESYGTNLIQSAIESAASMMRSKTTGSIPMMQQVIPVRNCNTIELLRAAVSLAESSKSESVFKSEVIAAITDVHWNLYGKADHIHSLIVYVLLLALFTVLIVMFDTWVTASYSLKILAWTLQGIKCIILTGYFVMQEVRELRHEVREFELEGFVKWFWDAWNIMDITAYSLIYAAVGVQSRSHPEQIEHIKAASVINAIAAVLLWFKLLHYMRPYKATGVLVSMIFKILLSIRPFILVLAIVVLGFATAFYTILSVNGSDDPLNYSSPQTALRSSFAYMLGDYELAVLDAGSPQVILSLLWVVFSVIVSILLLNLLIAIISYNYEKLDDSSEHSYMMEKTKVVILCNMKLSSNRKYKLKKLLTDMPYIVVFKPRVHTEKTDEWADRTDTITKRVTKAANNDVNSVRSDVNDAVTALTQDVDSLKTDVHSVNNAVNALEQDVDNVRTDVHSVNNGVTALTQDVSELKTCMQEILHMMKAQQSSTTTSSTAVAANNEPSAPQK
jgi:Ion transport protein